MSKSVALDEAQRFEEVFRDEIKSTINTYNQQHNFIIEKLQPKLTDFFVKSKKETATFKNLEEFSDKIYHNIRSAFRTAHNVETNTGIKLSASFQDVANKVITTTNDYSHVNDLIVHLCDFVNKRRI